MADSEQDEKVPDPEPRAVERSGADLMKAAAAAAGPMDLNAVMEAAGGEATAMWRASRARGAANRQAWDAYLRAEEAYWDIKPFDYFKLHAVATLRMVETTLLKTALTPEHRRHGWNERLVELLASMCAERRAQIETDTFDDPRAGYGLARNTLEEVSPKWPDTDDLSVAVDLAQRVLEIASHRLGLDTDSPRR